MVNLTVLIALEFNHTLQYVITRERGIIQAKIVILIAVLALVRKLMVADLSALGPAALAALAALLLALGITYWLMRERDDRVRAVRRRERAALWGDGSKRGPRPGQPFDLGQKAR